MMGPSTAHTPNDMPKIAVYIGRLLKGTSPTMTIMPPWKMPADPMPATALPMTNATDEGAAPQTTLPISKIRIAARKTHFVEYS